MCVCVCVCACVRVRLRLCACLSVRVVVCGCVCMRACMLMYASGGRLGFALIPDLMLRRSWTGTRRGSFSCGPVRAHRGSMHWLSGVDEYH